MLWKSSRPLRKLPEAGPRGCYQASFAPQLLPHCSITVPHPHLGGCASKGSTQEVDDPFGPLPPPVAPGHHP